MEKKLQDLFSYQAFERNPKLDKVIQETEARYPVELTDEELGNVSAAGVFQPVHKEKNDS